MNKQTKLYLGIGLVAVAAYLVFSRNKPTTTDENTTTSFLGLGKKRMVGVNGQAGEFYNVKSSTFN